MPLWTIKCLPIHRVNLDLDSTGNLHDFQRKLSTRHIVSLRAGEALGRQSWDLWMPLVTKLPLNWHWILWKPFWNARLDTSSGTRNLQPVCPVMFLVSKYGVQKLVYTWCRNKSRLRTKPFPKHQQTNIRLSLSSLSSLSPCICFLEALKLQRRNSNATITVEAPSIAALIVEAGAFWICTAYCFCYIRCCTRTGRLLLVSCITPAVPKAAMKVSEPFK